MAPPTQAQTPALPRTTDRATGSPARGVVPLWFAAALALPRSRLDPQRVCSRLHEQRAALVRHAQKAGIVPIASISPPQRLTIDQAFIEPSVITYGTRSFTARLHVSACGGPVQGALIYVTAVPFGQFSIPNEQPTGSDGIATLQFTALAGYSAASNNCS